VEKDLIERINWEKLQEVEENSIFAKIIKSNQENNPFLEKIQNQWNNLAWVSGGKKYQDDEDPICPYCQQSLTKEIIDNLNNLLDEGYRRDEELINSCMSKYDKEANRIIQQMKDQVAEYKEYFNNNEDNYRNLLEILERTINNNKSAITEKQKDPGREVKLDSTEDRIIEINKIIDKANEEVEENNKIASNAKEAKEKLKRQVWEKVRNDSDEIIRHYEKIISGLDEEIDKKKKNEGGLKDKLKEYQDRIGVINKAGINIQETADSINNMLNQFGFSNFKLKEQEEKYYAIEYKDGGNAFRGLSEGEKNFVTFLYFYYSLKGNANPDQLGEDKGKIIIIDDPVSSLDNDVLHVVSGLIRGLINSAMNKGEESNTHEAISINKLINPEQVFVLTHNPHFLRITGNHYVKKIKKEKVVFFRILKSSKIQRVVDNPILTSYEMLWGSLAEYKQIIDGNGDKEIGVGIQNSMRRILEYYFEWLGGIKFNDLPNKFNEGDEKSICHLLIDYLHVGSHGVDDSSFDISSNGQLDKFLDVFENIFTKLGHKNHYEMMMSKFNTTN
jgi:wobble nucleotide-excising tRNase